jgi:DNA-binding LacI/PurR family transcriptional regulator
MKIRQSFPVLIDSEGIYEKRSDEILKQIEKNGVTAFACYNDYIANWLIRYLEFKGYRVPEDVSVTGYDSDSSQSFLPLTTIDPKRSVIAAKVSEILLEKLKDPGHKAIQKIVIKSELIGTSARITAPGFFEN